VQPAQALLPITADSTKKSDTEGIFAFAPETVLTKRKSPKTILGYLWSIL